MRKCVSRLASRVSSLSADQAPLHTCDYEYMVARARGPQHRRLVDHDVGGGPRRSVAAIVLYAIGEAGEEGDGQPADRFIPRQSRSPAGSPSGRAWLPWFHVRFPNLQQESRSACRADAPVRPASPRRCSPASSRRTHGRRRAPAVSTARFSTPPHAGRLPRPALWSSIAASPGHGRRWPLHADGRTGRAAPRPDSADRLRVGNPARRRTAEPFVPDDATALVVDQFADFRTPAPGRLVSGGRARSHGVEGLI